MRAAVLTDPHRIELVERPTPRPGERQVRIKVSQCGVCASELDVFVGKAPEKLPAEIGHEVAGVVAEVGPGVSSIREGDPIAAWIAGGGFAEEVVADARFCVPVGGDVGYPAVAEPLACVVNSVELAAPALADDVVVIGAGYMGNLIQLVTALKGPRSIVVADVRPDALARAAALGATRVVDTSEASLADVVAEVTDGTGADVVYEVTGIGPGLALAGDATRMGGKLCIVGYHQGEPRPIPLGRWNWMAFQIVNAHFRDMDTIMAGMRAGMRLVSSGVLDVSGLVSDTFPLDRVEDAFEAAVAKRPGFVKAVVEPAA